MDVNGVAEEWSTVAASTLFCGAVTIIYLFSDFEEHQPLFFIFLWLSFCALAVEFGGQLLTSVVGETVAHRVKSSARSSTFCVCRVVDFLVQLHTERRATFFWTLNCFFVVLFCISSQMDDASLVYAACILLGASPVLRKLLGKSARELVNRASRLLQPPMTESTELADYLPHTNEVSQDFSVTTIRRNSFESTVTETEMEISVFDASALQGLDTSAISLLGDSVMRESQMAPLMEQSMASSKATDDDFSPIHSDVEVIDADDIPDDFPHDVSIQTGHLHSGTGSYTPSGTLRRDRKKNKKDVG